MGESYPAKLPNAQYLKNDVAIFQKDLILSVRISVYGYLIAMKIQYQTSVECIHSSS